MIPSRHRGFAVFTGLAALSAAVVWFGMPHDREVKNLGVFLVKLLPFVFAAEAVARLDVEWARRVRLPLIAIPGAFLVYFLYFVPKIFFYGGENSDNPESFGNLYYHVLTLTPMIILALVLAHRLGGGTGAMVRRLSYGLLLLMLSGLEDLAFLVGNDHVEPAFQKIPETWTWASHITVFLGHPPSKYEAYAFITVHVALAVFVFLSPQRWWESVLRRTRVRPAVADQGAHGATGRDTGHEAGAASASDPDPDADPDPAPAPRETAQR